MSRSPLGFYLQEDVVSVSRQLLGKTLHTRVGGRHTAGIIVETEAYRGPEDRASHAYGGRRTARTEVMFAQGGTAYVYLCYGIHHLFNVVTHQAGVPHAVLVRALQPVAGLPIMLKRRKMKEVAPRLTAGPGSLAVAMGITTALSGASLLGKEIWIEDSGLIVPDKHVVSAPRIGVDYAGAHAKRPWRFYIKDNDWVSKR